MTWQRCIRTGVEYMRLLIERQALWRTALRQCGGDAARADVVLSAELRASNPPRREPAPIEPSKDWFVHHPGPDPQLVKWLHDSHAEWAARLSKSRDTHCEQCGVRVTLARPRKRIWCSEECSRAWYNAHRARAQHAEKACSQCGNTFQPTRADSRYCSHICRQAAYRRRGVTVLSDIRHNAAVPKTTAIETYAVWNLSISRQRQPPLGRAA